MKCLHPLEQAYGILNNSKLNTRNDADVSCAMTYLLTAYAKNSDTTLVEPFKVIVFRVACACFDMLQKNCVSVGAVWHRRHCFHRCQCGSAFQAIC